jgi:hypothetical protein
VPNCTAIAVKSKQTASSSSSILILAVAAGGGGALLIVVLVLVLVLRQRRKRNAGTREHVSQLESLVTQKVEKLFTLAFAGRFSEQELTVARADFLGLEVPRRSIKLDRLVGQGQSGEVHLALLTWPRQHVHSDWNARGGKGGVTVAIKLQGSELVSSSDASSLANFNTAGEESLQLEARLLHQLRHPHIVQVLATVMLSFPTWICLEFMPNGDLKSYLRCGLLVVF